MWADYFVKFFDGYAENGIKFWGVTTQNEPASGIFFGTINNLAWTPQTMVEWCELLLFRRYFLACFIRFLGLMNTLDQLSVIRNTLI